MKKAFTMMELVFVIVVVGILSTMIAPNFQRNSLREAADQLISHIRYTQHLAMMDDVYDPSKLDWYKNRWQLIFTHTINSEEVWAYSIFKNTLNHTNGNLNISDTIAKNPLDITKYLSGGYPGVLSLTDSRVTKKMALALEYGITNVQFLSGCSSARRISFDYIGRPIEGSLNTSNSPYQSNRIITTQCKIVLSNPDKNITIAIEPETGYAHIL